MYIFNRTSDGNGSWYVVKRGGDFRFSQRASDTLGGGTLKIETADGAKREFPVSADRTFSAVMEPTIVTLTEGEHVRITLAGATAPNCNVDAQHTTDQGDSALEVA
jgi:hypothetical protein